jgi:DNA-binding XRE family transcriptional regulator
MDEVAVSRFWDKVDKDEPGDCWEWTASVGSHGYGQIWDGFTNWLAHRFSYHIHHGPIPDGLFVCHHCDNKRCVNPDHLFLGTTDENMADAVRKGRMESGEDRYNSKLTEPEVLEIVARHDAGESQSALAEDYGVSRGTINSIVAGYSWRCVTGKEAVRKRRPSGEDCRYSKLTAQEVLEIVQRCEAGELQKDVAADYGVARTTISSVVNGYSWKEVTGK